MRDQQIPRGRTALGITLAVSALIAGCEPESSGPSDADGPTPALPEVAVFKTTQQPMLASAPGILDDRIITFDNLAEGTDVGASYQTAVGAVFGGAVVLASGSQLNPVFPPRSSPNVVYNGLSPSISLTLDTPGSSVGFYVTANGGTTITCRNTAGTTVGSATTPTNYTGAGTPNFLVTISGDGIKSCIVTANDGQVNRFTLDDVTLGDCKVTASSFGQGQAPWGRDLYDGTNKLMKDKGCALTSLAMGLTAFRVPTTPGALNTALKQANSRFFLPNGNVKWGEIVQGASGGSVSWTWIGGSTQAIGEALCKKKPVVIGVRNNSHFVLAVRKEGPDIVVIDPGSGSGVEQKLSSYSGVGVKGALKGPGSISPSVAPRGRTHLTLSSAEAESDGLSLSATNALLLLTSPDGKRVGLGSTTGEPLAELPGSGSTRDRLEDDLSGQPGKDESHYIYIPSAPVGTYQLSILPLVSGIQQLGVNRIPGGATIPDPALGDILGQAGVPIRLGISFGMSGKPIIMRSGGPAALRLDIASGTSIGLIERGIATALRQLADAAEAALRRGDRSAAAGQVTAMRQLVQAQSGKLIDSRAAMVLLEDIAAVQAAL